jgi:hypothetical protein
MDGFEPPRADAENDRPPGRTWLRATLIVASVVLVMAGLLVVGALVFVSAALSSWGSNK